MNKWRLYPYIASTVFTAEWECVYCAVRTEPLNVIEVNIGRSQRRLGSSSRPV